MIFMNTHRPLVGLRVGKARRDIREWEGLVHPPLAMYQLALNIESTIGISDRSSDLD